MWVDMGVYMRVTWGLTYHPRSPTNGARFGTSFRTQIGNGTIASPLWS